MKFNASKSKVMVIGKRLDKHKEWKLGNSMLIETNDYKYLGVYFSGSLSFSYHINCYLKEKFERKFNYMIKLLGEHGTFNRISFGDALWTVNLSWMCCMDTIRFILQRYARNVAV